MMETLLPFWRYYGGKWRAAPRYEAPRYDTIVEPFAGAAGYSLRHYRREVILVDRYDAITDLWRYLIAVSPDDVMRIPIVDQIDDLPSDHGSGARLLVGWNLNTGNTGPRNTLSSGLRERQAAGIGVGWCAQYRERVARQVGCIRHWRVISGDYASSPDIKATWFIDPPYQAEGIHYQYGSDLIDYAALGEWCQTRRGQTIVCETEGASWLPFRPFGAFKSSLNIDADDRALEMIWESGESQPRLL